MKAFALYLAITAVAVNVAGNIMANTADGIKAAQEARTEQLCQANRAYC